MVEVAGLGPAPFAALMLAGLGAEVIRVDRPGPANPGNPLSPQHDLLNRGRRSVAVDLKSMQGREVLLRLLESSDVVLEGFRPGVAERLGVGPETCLARNPALIYGRMTGWGQQGPWAQRAGHDINYIALSGAMEPMGSAGGPPLVPLNVVGDFGGGGMLLAYGVVAALWERARSGRGQVVDAAIVDGASVMMTMFHAMRAQGVWRDERGANLLDGGAHFYGVYPCSDGRYLSVGAIEPQFYSQLLTVLGLQDDADFQRGHRERELWPRLAERLIAVFAVRTRDEWVELFDGVDACVAPVLALDEVAEHPHNRERESFEVVGGIAVPRIAPRFSRTASGVPCPPPRPGEHTVEILVEVGIGDGDIARLRELGAVHQHDSEREAQAEVPTHIATHRGRATA